MSPHRLGHKIFLWMAGKDKKAMRRDATTVAEWDFERIILCHGVRMPLDGPDIVEYEADIELPQDVIEKDAKKAWVEAYKWYLD